MLHKMKTHIHQGKWANVEMKWKKKHKKASRILESSREGKLINSLHALKRFYLLRRWPPSICFKQRRYLMFAIARCEERANTEWKKIKNYWLEISLKSLHSQAGKQVNLISIYRLLQATTDWNFKWFGNQIKLKSWKDTHDTLLILRKC